MDSEITHKTLLAAKRVKVNPGIPVAAIQKHVEQKNLGIPSKPAIPPIKRDEAERASTADAIGRLSQQVQMSMDADIPPAEGGETVKMDTPFSFLNYLKLHPTTDEFVYLIPVISTLRGQPSYNPYNLQIVDFFQVNTKSSEGYYTMSAKVIALDNRE